MILISIHEPLLLEINALLDEDFGHGDEIVVAAEVLALDLIVFDVEVVFWAPDNSKVW